MEINKTIPVHFDDWQKVQYNKDAIAQWNRGIQLDISGLDISEEKVEVHFSLEEVSGNATRRVGTVENGVISVKIPAFILEGPEYVYGDRYCAWAWVYVSDEESAETIRKICFTIAARPKPEDYVRDEEEVKLWSALEKEIEEVKDKQDFVAKYGITTFQDVKEAYERGCDIRVKYTVEIKNSLAPGTYDADGNLLQTWDELMDAWGRDIQAFSPPPNDLAYVISSDATKLVIPEGITKIGGYILTLNSCNIETVVLPNTLTSIYSGSMNLPTLKQLAVPNGVEIFMPYSSTFERVYFNGKLQGPYVTSIECLPYEDAPAELVPGKDTIYYLLGNLELVGDEFVFYTTQDDKQLKIVCNADGWSSEEIEYALSEDIPKKVSELENDEDYAKKYVIVNDFTTAEEFEKCIEGKTPMYYAYTHEGVEVLLSLKIFDNGVYCFAGFLATLEFAALFAEGEWKIQEPTEYAKKSSIPTKVSELTNDAKYAKTSQLPTKTSQLTNDSGYLTDAKVFIGTYGVTTYDEIVKAYEAGKIVSLIIPLEDKTVMASLTMPNAIGDSGYNFTFAGDENGTSHYANIDYASKKWVYWFCDYYRMISDSLELGNNAANEHEKRKMEISKITTNYQKVDIAANGKFQLREKGFYIFGGADYDLNLCDASGNTIGKTKSLVVVVFCTEAREDGTFDVYVMQNYKNILTPSMDGMPYSNFTKNHYVHNTNTSSPAYVYYMRQNEV